MRTHRTFVVVAAVAAFFVLAFAAGADPGANMATITINPSPATAGTTSSASVSGLEPGAGLQITEENPESLFFFSQTADADGNVEFSVPADIPGDVVVKVYENLHGNKYTLVAEATLPVS